ncbi:MAG TPA: ABC transporter permease, partial [Nitrososphaeria archaeon]|nr:ABC transporter permease [Nitrososphaeria archaeon]
MKPTIRKGKFLSTETRITISIMLRSKITIASILLLITIYIVAIAAPLIAPRDPYTINTGALLLPPTKEYPLGTDNLGRDVLSRIIYGARVSVFVPILVVGLIVLIGVPVGLI